MLKPTLCCTKNLMRSVHALGLGWRRRVFLLARLKGKNNFVHCSLCLNCVILGLGGILGFWGGLVFLALAFILGHPIPYALITILVGPFGSPEDLIFLENSRICNAKKNDSPGMPYIEGEIEWELPRLKFDERVTNGKNPAQFPTKSSTVGSISRCRTWGTWSRKNLMAFNEGASRISKRQERDLDS